MFLGCGIIQVVQKMLLKRRWPNKNFIALFTSNSKLDVDPQRDDDASPISTYRCMLRPTWMISALQHKSKYKSNSISNFFEKKIIFFFWFPYCSTREDLSVDVSITNVGLILTKLRWFQLFVKSQNSNFELFWKKKKIGFPCCTTREDLSIDVSITNVGLILTKLRWFQLFVKSQNSNFELFWKKNPIFGFPWRSTREYLSIDVSITNVGLILTKLRWFQLFVKSQNSNFELFWKKNQIFGFPWRSTREDLSIDVSITNVGLILTKLWWFLFSGYGQMDRQTDGQTDRRTDTVLESSYGNMSAHKKFQLKAQNQWLAVDPYMPPRRSGMHN